MIHLRTLLPPEHGAWGFLACGVAAALLTAPSWAGALLAIMLALSICARHAVRRALLSGNRELLMAAVVVCGACLVLALLTDQLAAAWWWAPLALAAPLAFGQLLSEQVRRERHSRRSILESVVGIAALAAGGAAVALAGGAEPIVAAQIAGVVSAYGACTVPYVRARLGRGSQRLSLIVHGLALLAALLAIAAGASWVLLCMLPLALRAWIAPHRPRQSPAAAGIEELVVGLLIAAVVGVGLHG